MRTHKKMFFLYFKNLVTIRKLFLNLHPSTEAEASSAWEQLARNKLMQTFVSEREYRLGTLFSDINVRLYALKNPSAFYL